MSATYDYTLKFYKDDKLTGSNTYQKLIRLLAIENEIVSGRPLKAGGAPQAMVLKGLLEKQVEGSRVDVYSNGNQMF